MTEQEKRAAYATLRQEAAAVLEGESNVTARMATLSCLLMEAFPGRFIWAGFYLVDPEKPPEKPDELVVGPYQGSLGCLRIAFGKGVCGAAASRGESLMVADVRDFPGHIACDARSRSELVVPVVTSAAELIGVLDIDAAAIGEFDEIDREEAEELIREMFAVGATA